MKRFQPSASFAHRLRDHLRALLGTFLWALLLTASHGQREERPLPAGVDFFGDPPAAAPASDSNDIDSPHPEEPPGYAHVLLFRDGRQLRGEISALGNGEILWRRPDASERLRIPSREVRRIIFKLEPESPDDSREANGVPATVQFAGNDWLYGQITSSDGRNFSLKISPDFSLAFARSSIDWVLFGEPAMPAQGYGEFASTGRASLGMPADPKFEEGLLVLPEEGWHFPLNPARRRFEITLEVPEDGESFTRVAFGVEPIDRKTGRGETTTIQLSRNLLICRGLFENRQVLSAAIPESDQENGALATYRILFDNVARRLVIMRNGLVVVDRQGEKRANPGDAGVISGITFLRSFQGAPAALKIRRLRIQPWDGFLAAPGEAALMADRLCTNQTAAVTGALESISAREIVFSGESKPIGRPGTMLQFPGGGAALDRPSCRLFFENDGEISAADLKITDGSVQCRTVFADSIRPPLAALDAIQFCEPAEAAPSAAARPSDLLVFKNGDQLQGALIGAADGQRLRWRLTSGQEIDLATGRIAGIRFASPTPAPGHRALATVEMCNGDRVRGEFLSLDAHAVHLRNAPLGNLAVDREAILQLLPNGQFEIWDGARTPAGAPVWTAATSREALERSAVREWVYLDGSYLIKLNGNIEQVSEQSGLLLASPKDVLPDRFLLAFEATDYSGDEPGFAISVGDDVSGPGLALAYSDGSLGVDFTDPKDINRVKNWELSVSGKIPQHRSRVSVAVYFDTKIGTTDIFLDGIPIALLGHKPSDRVAGLASPLRVEPVSYEAPMVFSNIRIVPWDGELPRGEQSPAGISFTNGDLASGEIKGTQDGTLTIESELGPISPRLESIQSIDFGHRPDPATKRPAARLRFPDGSILQLDTYRWDPEGLTGHSATLGEVKIPAKSISELLLDPPRLTFPSQRAANPRPQNAPSK